MITSPLKFPGLGFVRHAPPPSPVLGQSFDKMFGWSELAGDAMRLAVHGGMAVFGIYAGQELKGIPSIVGWALGVLNICGALADAMSMVEILAGPAKPQETPS